jgi:hypothetical protein
MRGLDSLKLASWCLSPVLSDIGDDDDPDDMPAVQEERLLLKLSFVCHVSFSG